MPNWDFWQKRTLLTLEHIQTEVSALFRQRLLQSASSAVVNQSHPDSCSILFSFRTIMSGHRFASFFSLLFLFDYPAVQVVQVGSCETSAFQLYHRTEIRRNYRNTSKNHPLRSIAGLFENLDDFQSFTRRPLLTGRLRELFPELFRPARLRRYPSLAA